MISESVQQIYNWIFIASFGYLLFIKPFIVGRLVDECVVGMIFTSNAGHKVDFNSSRVGSARFNYIGRDVSAFPEIEPPDPGVLEIHFSSVSPWIFSLREWWDSYERSD